jgi:DNA-binding CsgD family transcriptional regulator
VVDLARRGLDLLEAAHAPEPAPAAARAFLAQGLILAGDVAAGRPLLDAAAARLAEAGEQAHPPLTRAVVLGLLWIGDTAGARRILDRVVEEARAASAAGALPYPLAVLAVADARAGRWDAAEAVGAEAARLAVETGQPSVEALARVGAAQVAAGRGRVAACDALAARIDAASEAAGADSLLLWSAAARGLARLGARDPGGAIVDLERADRLARDRGVTNPSVVPYAADLAEALLTAGRRDDAEAVLERLRASAAAAGDTWSRLVTARCAGLLARGPGWEDAFAEALSGPGAHEMPFEHARTRLVLGERLRRERRPGEARPHLRAASETFARLGADPWRARADDELRATGEHGRRAARPSRPDLTPQEALIARAVARGATNREVAAELALSHKTVEHHLTRVYAKLGVRSRTELAVLMSAGSP